MGRFKLPDNFVGNVSKDEVQGAHRRLSCTPDTMATPYNPIVVNTGSKLVLIDTGTGEAALRRAKAPPGS